MTRNERLQRKFERRLLNEERWQNTISFLTMSREWHKYMEGHEMLSGEFRTVAGARLFGEQVWEDHHRDQVIAQFDFNGELHWKKVHPITPELTPEQKHLAEERPLKSGITMTVFQVDQLDRNLEILRVAEIKQELEAICGDREI